MAATRRNVRVGTNEDFIVKARFMDGASPATMVAGHLRGVTLQGVELFEAAATQDGAGWIIGRIPQAQMALIAPQTGRYDLICEFAGTQRRRAITGDVVIEPGVAQWS